MTPSALELLKTQGVPRNGKWPAFRRAQLAGQSCHVCGKKVKLELHHILPFHLYRELELDPANVIPLCEGNKQINCHLMFGHWGNFATKYNPGIKVDAPKWLARFEA